MYDCIVVESPLLPNGVNLPEVLEGAAESEVKEVLASMPEPGQRISAAALVAAGVCRADTYESYGQYVAICLTSPERVCVHFMHCSEGRQSD